MTSLIRGISYHLPEGFLDIEKLDVERPDWDIKNTVAKTGIRRVRRAPPSETTVDMAVKAASAMSEPLRSDPPDTVLFCTQTPDFLIPHCSAIFQDRMAFPTNVRCFDVNLGCSGYPYSLFLLYGLLESSLSRSALLVTADSYSKIMSPDDKKTALLFSDGASCTLLERPAAPPVFRFGTSGADHEKIIYPMSGVNRVARNKIAQGSPINPEGQFEMDGNSVFLFTMSVVVDEIKALLASANKTIDDVDFFVLHQASLVVLDSVQRKLGIPAEKMVIDIAEVGNTTSSSIPIALCRAEKAGRIARGSTLLLFGFGIGLSWGGCIIEF